MLKQISTEWWRDRSDAHWNHSKTAPFSPTPINLTVWFYHTSQYHSQTLSMGNFIKYSNPVNTSFAELALSAKLLQFSSFWSACFLCSQLLLHSELCCSLILKNVKITVSLSLSLSNGFQRTKNERIQYKINTFWHNCIRCAALTCLCDCL